MPLGGAAYVGVVAHVGVAQPDAGHKVGRLRLKGVEVAVQRQQHKDVLLGVVPAAAGAVRQQPVDHLGDQVARGVAGDQRVQDDGVGAPVRVQQQVGLVAVGGGKVGRPGRLHGAVVEVAADGLHLGRGGRVVGQHLPQPGQPPPATAPPGPTWRPAAGGPWPGRGRPSGRARRGRRRSASGACSLPYQSG